VLLQSFITFYYLSLVFCNWKIRVFLGFSLATRWKYLVLEPLSSNSFTFAGWYHLISSSLSMCTILLLRQFFKSNSANVNSVSSTFYLIYTTYSELSFFIFYFFTHFLCPTSIEPSDLSDFLFAKFPYIFLWHLYLSIIPYSYQ
jgi:hypothetical protein